MWDGEVGRGILTTKNWYKGRSTDPSDVEKHLSFYEYYHFDTYTFFIFYAPYTVVGYQWAPQICGCPDGIYTCRCMVGSAPTTLYILIFLYVGSQEYSIQKISQSMHHGMIHATLLLDHASWSRHIFSYRPVLFWGFSVTTLPKTAPRTCVKMV